MKRPIKYLLFYFTLILLIIPFFVYKLMHRCDSIGEKDFIVEILIVQFLAHFIFSRLLYNKGYLDSLRKTIITFLPSYSFLITSFKIEILNEYYWVNLSIFLVINLLLWEFQLNKFKKSKNN